MAAQLDALRQRKADFASTRVGTSAAECALLCAAAPAGLALRRALSLAGAPRSGALGFALDIATLAAPPLAAMLRPEAAAQLVAALLVAAAALSLRAAKPRRRAVAAVVTPPSAVHGAFDAYRACLMVMTCCAILAVDFPAFPRRLAKTAATGTGFMDLGPGSFVFAHGLVSRDARGVASRRAGALRRAVPLLLLGGARLAAVASTGYVVPVGEYGAHWNFFFTLAAVAALAAASPAPARGGAVAAAGMAAAVLAAHGAALASGLAAWLDDTHRGGDLLSQNREGLVSVPGYWGLYLGGVAVGRLLLPSSAVKGKRTTTALATPALRRAAVLAAALWCGYSNAGAALGPPSRRSANPAYALWILAHNTATLAAMLGLEAAAAAAAATAAPLPQPRLAAAVSRAMLPTFLAANVLTGAVNLSIDTMAVPDATAAAGLAAYMTAVSGAALLAAGSSA